MKKMKRIVSLILTFVLVLAMAAPTMAAVPTTGSITIKGSKDTDPDHTVTVVGKTFNAYKVLNAELADENGKNVIYRVPEELAAFYKDYLSLPSSFGEASFDQDVTEAIYMIGKSDSDEVAAFAKAVLKAAKKADITPVAGTGRAADEEKGIEADDTEVVLTGLPLGYYVIEDVGTAKPISALILDTTTPNVEVNIKATTTVVNKNIDGDNDTDDTTSGKVKENNEAIGDIVPYIVESTVPDMRGYDTYKYTVVDTLSRGLTYNDNNGTNKGEVVSNDGKTYVKGIIVKIDGNTLTENVDYTVDVDVKSDDSTEITIDFIDFLDKNKANNGKNIVITYSATVNEKAELGTEGNENKIYVEHSSNPNGGGTSRTPDITTITYVTGIKLTKVDSDNNTLKGAKFKIEGTKQNVVIINKAIYSMDNDNGTYYRLKDGTYTTVAPTQETQDNYENVNMKFSKVEEVTQDTQEEEINGEGYVDENGVISFEGLAAGTYTITELIAPNGYNLLKTPITLTITWSKKDDTLKDCTWTATASMVKNSGEGKDNITSDPLEMNADGVFELDVINYSGVELPSTGGIGTTIFYVLGAILVLAAGVILVTRKRMSMND